MIEENLPSQIRAERGNPSEAELAAAIAMVIEASKLERKSSAKQSSSWSQNPSALRGEINPTIKQWRSSLRP